jgi:hypothetical protein
VREGDKKARAEESGEGEGNLKQQPEQEARLCDEVRGKGAAGRQPLDVLLDDEADRGKQRASPDSGPGPRAHR